MPFTEVPVASIDVEFAHFLSDGNIVTAAAEVCLVRDNGAVLLHSYISPGASWDTAVKLLVMS